MRRDRPALAPLRGLVGASRPARAAGAALILVLWLIALLSALVGTFAMTARIEHLQARVLDRGLVAREAARAGHLAAQVEYAIMMFNGTGVVRDQKIAAARLDAGDGDDDVSGPG